MRIDSDIYDFVLVLHILATIIGFGGTFIAAFYGAESRTRPGREGQAVAEATLKVTGLVPTMAVYSVPVLGILLVMLSEDTWQFSDVWISLSFVLYIALLVLAIVVQVPTVRRMVALRAAAGDGAPPPELAAMGKKVATVGGIVNLLWVAVLFLMVFKPGT